MTSFSAQLNVPSLLKYGTWRALGQRGPVNLTLKSGVNFQLRPNAAGQFGNNDYGVAYEIFVHDYYAVKGDLASNEPRLIVDLGGNAGFSTLYWLHRFKQCEVIVFELHPSQIKQIQLNVALNGWSDRVTLFPYGAGVAASRAKLSDKGAGSSTKLFKAEDRFIDVELIDLFPVLRDRKIDILKIDIEGGEYAIMADDRFADLNTRAVVMEWHQATPGRDDKAWCVERLTGLGYEIEELWNEETHGMLWARRRHAPYTG